MLDTEAQTTPLSLYEREALISDVLNELFGLGPLEQLLHDPAISDILVNRYNQVYIERNGKLEEAVVVFRDDKHLLQIIERIVSSVGPAHRRVEPDGGRPPAGRLARQRHHPAAVASTGPALSIRRFRTDRLGSQDLVDRDSLTQPMLDFLKAAVGRTPERPDLGRHRRRQDHAAQRAVRLHLRPRAHHHHRGRRRADAAPAPRRAARNAAAQHRGQGRGSPAASW